MRKPFFLASDAGSRFDAQGLPASRPPRRLVTLLAPAATPPDPATGQADETAAWFDSVLAEPDRTAGTH